MKKQDLCQSDKLSNVASEAHFFFPKAFLRKLNILEDYFFLLFFYHDHSNARGLGFKPFQCLSDTRGEDGRGRKKILTRRRMLNYFPSLVLNVKLWKRNREKKKYINEKKSTRRVQAVYCFP